MFTFMLLVQNHLVKEEGEECLAVSDDLSELNTCSYKKRTLATPHFVLGHLSV